MTSKERDELRKNAYASLDHYIKAELAMKYSGSDCDDEDNGLANTLTERFNGNEKAETLELQEYFKTKQNTAIFLYMKIDNLEKKYTEEKE